MKKIILCLIAFVSILMITGCTSKEENTLKKLDEMKFNTLGKALDYYYELYNNSDDDNFKNELMNKLNDYVINDANGNYYSYNSMWYAKKSQNRYIYIKSKDEVYIIPFEDEDVSVDNLEKIENLEQYKYKIINVETNQNDGAYHRYKRATIKFQSYLLSDRITDDTNEYYKYIKLEYFSDDNDYTMTGFFAETITEEDDFTVSPKGSVNSTGYYGYNHYYRTKSELDTQNAKDQAEKEKKEAIKNSIPKVGMTASEVKQTKWGSPDKINKDTYSWGTTEQWVYNKYGYVYFENGKVTSVSER